MNSQKSFQLLPLNQEKVLTTREKWNMDHEDIHSDAVEIRNQTKTTEESLIRETNVMNDSQGPVFQVVHSNEALTLR